MPSARITDFSRAGIYFSAALLIAAAGLAWAGSFHGAFVLDDMPAITENPTIRHFGTAFSPPADGQTVSGRPLVNLSFALNWAIGGESVTGYHALNLAIHVLAGLVMFGLARRTLLSPTLATRFTSRATPLAGAIAACWMLHPLQTESVTYISQRAESLAGLWLLFTLYAAARGAACHPLNDQRPQGAAAWWNIIAVGACLLGMASKEIMFAAPILVLLHDRAFFAGTFRGALRGRPWLYGGLASTWLLLGWLVWHTGNRGSTAGFGLGISPWHYLLTQCGAIVQYLRLVVWPAPLVLDYGFATVGSPTAVWWQGLTLLGLFVAALCALARCPPWGFLGAWFFLLLAPSSSILPVATQTIAEHRMYLPLAAVIAAGVIGWWSATERHIWLGTAAVCAALGTLTAARNASYHSAIAIWQDTVAKRPGNARAFGELANALLHAKRIDDALAAYETALRLLPNFPKAHHNYAGALANAGRLDEAAAQYKLAIAQQPSLAEAQYGLGNVRREQGRLADALAGYEAAIRLRPDFAFAHNNAANLLANLGRTDEALQHFAAAARAQPDFPDAEYNWGNLLARTGRLADAVPHYEAALRLAPDFVAAHENFGVTLVNLGRVTDGIRELETAQRLAPERGSIRAALDFAHGKLGR